MEVFLWVCQRISFCCWSTAKFLVKYTLFWFISVFISLTKYSVYLHPTLGVDQHQILAVHRQYIGMLLIDNVFHSVALHLAYCCRSTHLEIVGTTLARPPFLFQTIPDQILTLDETGPLVACIDGHFRRYPGEVRILAVAVDIRRINAPR